MDGWPLTKLLAAAALADAARAPKLAVLLTTGALNPAHLGHLDAVRRARRCLEAEVERSDDRRIKSGWLSSLP